MSLWRLGKVLQRSLGAINVGWKPVSLSRCWLPPTQQWPAIPLGQGFTTRRYPASAFERPTGGTFDGDFLSITRTGAAMSYPSYVSSVVQRAAEDVSLLDEFRSENVSLLDEFRRLFFSNSNLTVNLYPVLIFGASIGLVLLLTFLMSEDGSNSARVEKGYAANPQLQQGHATQQGYGQGQRPQEGNQAFNGAAGLPLALAGYGYIVPVFNQNGYNSGNQPFVNVGYSSWDFIPDNGERLSYKEHYTDVINLIILCSKMLGVIPKGIDSIWLFCSAIDKWLFCSAINKLKKSGVTIEVSYSFWFYSIPNSDSFHLCSFIVGS